MFEYRITWYNEYEDKEELIRGLAYGNTYAEALDNVIKDYGAKCIIDIYLQALEDTATIELNVIKEQFNL